MRGTAEGAQTSPAHPVPTKPPLTRHTQIEGRQLRGCGIPEPCRGSSNA